MTRGRMGIVPRCVAALVCFLSPRLEAAWLPNGLAFVAAVIAAASAAHASWIPDGNAVCTAANTQVLYGMVSDGAGGAIVIWTDYRALPDFNIFAQRIDDAGNTIWTPQGLSLCSAPYRQASQKSASDGIGGAIAAWTDERKFGTTGDADIYAQRVTSGGYKWNADGIAVCDLSSNQSIMACAPDGSHGAYVMWEDDRDGNSIYAQRIDAGANRLWATGGVPICTAVPGAINLGQAASIGPDAIFAWYDTRNGTCDIFAQRVSSAGSVLWAEDGLSITAKTDTFEYLVGLASDNAGGAILWWFEEGDTARAFVQRIDGSGSPLWSAGGVPVCTAAGHQNPHLEHSLIAWGTGGAIVVWEDDRSGSYDIYAQRVDASGNLLWGSEGLAVCTAAGNQGDASIIQADESSVLIAWSDPRNGSGDVYAQKIDSLGTVLWAADGIAVCTQASGQGGPWAVPDDGGGAVIAWSDGRNGNTDLYAQRALGTGCIAGSAPPFITSILDVPSDQGGFVNVVWNRSYFDCLPDTDITHYSIWRSISGAALAALRYAGAREVEPAAVGMDFSGKAIRMAPLAGALYAWEWLANTDAHHLESYAYAAATLYDSLGGDPGWHYFFVSAHTSNPAVYYDSPQDSGYSVDNLSPTPPTSLAGEVTHDPNGLMLTWDPNTEGDLGLYRVYRGLSEDFVPGPGNMLATPMAPAYWDAGWSSGSGYYYKVSVADVHGNESAHALLRPEEVTGVETPEAPAVTYLRQNVPNPFNPTTRIAFGLAAPGHVSLRIYDAMGRLVRELLNESRPAARYEEVWDGRDGAERLVASGIYFYRLDAGAFAQTRKMILLR